MKAVNQLGRVFLSTPFKAGPLLAALPTSGPILSGQRFCRLSLVTSVTVARASALSRRDAIFPPTQTSQMRLEALLNVNQPLFNSRFFLSFDVNLCSLNRLKAAPLIVCFVELVLSFGPLFLLLHSAADTNSLLHVSLFDCVYLLPLPIPNDQPDT